MGANSLQQILQGAMVNPRRWDIEHANDPAAAAGAGFESLVLPRIHSALAELFECAVAEMGDSSQWPSSRGLYGVDVMLQEGTRGGGYEPVLLEVNFSPDASTILKYHPSFYDEVFDVLFTPTPPTVATTVTGQPRRSEGGSRPKAAEAEDADKAFRRRVDAAAARTEAQLAIMLRAAPTATATATAIATATSEMKNSMAFDAVLPLILNGVPCPQL
jgi:hypothetical protein